MIRSITFRLIQSADTFRQIRDFMNPRLQCKKTVLCCYPPAESYFLFQFQFIKFVCKLLFCWIVSAKFAFFVEILFLIRELITVEKSDLFKKTIFCRCFPAKSCFIWSRSILWITFLKPCFAESFQQYPLFLWFAEPLTITTICWYPSAVSWFYESSTSMQKNCILLLSSCRIVFFCFNFKISSLFANSHSAGAFLQNPLFFDLIYLLIRELIMGDYPHSAAFLPQIHTFHSRWDLSTAARQSTAWKHRSCILAVMQLQWTMGNCEYFICFNNDKLIFYISFQQEIVCSGLIVGFAEGPFQSSWHSLTLFLLPVYPWKIN